MAHLFLAVLFRLLPRALVICPQYELVCVLAVLIHFVGKRHVKSGSVDSISNCCWAACGICTYNNNNNTTTTATTTTTTTTTNNNNNNNNNNDDDDYDDDGDEF